MVTPVAFDSIKFHTYTVFAVINAAIVPCVYFFYPETAGRSLEEMDAYVIPIDHPPSTLSYMSCHGRTRQIIQIIQIILGSNRIESLTKKTPLFCSIFHKTQGKKGYFDVVRIAREEPRRYGKHGELLISYEETEEHKRHLSVAEEGGHGHVGTEHHESSSHSNNRHRNNRGGVGGEDESSGGHS